MPESDIDPKLATALRELESAAESRFSADLHSGVAEQWLAKARAEVAPEARTSDVRTRRGPWWSRRRPQIIGLAGIAVAVAAVLLKPSQTDISLANETSGTYTTATGEQTVITLPDGSTMTLAPRTSARLASFGDGARTVVLTGEAYFDVVPIPDRPFIVQAGGTRTQVLGTTFNVRAYDASAIRVAVTSGKVAVSVAGYRGEPLVLSAGNGLSITDSVITPLSSGDALRDARWTTGELVFRNAPARDVLRALTDWFGYQFHATDSLLVAQRITASFSTRSATTALSTLKLVFDADLSVQNKTITLTPKARVIPVRRDHTVQSPTHEVGR